MPLDAEIVFYLNSHISNSPFLSNLTVFFASYLPWIVVFSVGLWLFFSKVSRKEKLLLFLTTLSSVVVTRFGVVEAFRFFYQRPRPYLEYTDIHALFTVHEWSFPSGHAAFFFSFATAIFFYHRKLGIVLFTASILISIGRVAAGVHYPSDILGGMTIGIFVATTLVHTLRRALKEKDIK